VLGAIKKLVPGLGGDVKPAAVASTPAATAPRGVS
jgi:hypothetical protein